jgi:predicted kinase
VSGVTSSDGSGIVRCELVILGGLPGTGKTSVARELARLVPAVHVRVDTIEQALRRARGRGGPVDETGYLVAHAVAADNLRLGRVVIADSVNPIEESRAGWREVARRADVRFIEVEVVCSDAAEHRRRVETRAADIEGLELPTWQAVKTREYEAWVSPHLVIDTAAGSVQDCARQIATALESV